MACKQIKESETERHRHRDKQTETGRESETEKAYTCNGLTGVPNLLNMNVPRQIGMLPIISNLQING